MAGAGRRRNHLDQYHELADRWWEPDGPFAALQWIAAARRELIPPAPPGGGRLLDLACGGGLLAPHAPVGYDHVGIDLVTASLRQASAVGVRPVLGDAGALPFPDGTFDVVVAGEILEHVPDVDGVVAEIARVTAEGGTVIVDTIADTVWARLVAGDRCRTAPRRAAATLPRSRSVRRSGTPPSRVRGTRHRPDVARPSPAPLAYLRYLLTRRGDVPMQRIRSLAGLYAGVGTKQSVAATTVGRRA